MVPVGRVDASVPSVPLARRGLSLHPHEHTRLTCERLPFGAPTPGSEVTRTSAGRPSWGPPTPLGGILLSACTPMPRTTVLGVYTTVILVAWVESYEENRFGP